MVRKMTAISLAIDYRQLGRRLGAIPLTWLATYSQIYFARNRVSGALFMAATFVVPIHGVSGLLGLVATDFWAWLLNRPPQHRREGYYGFNGLLVGLALGLYFRFTPALIALLLIATLLTVLVAAVLRSLTEQYLGVPVLSLAFVWVTWISLLATHRLINIEVTLSPVLVSGWGAGLLPAMPELFLRSLATSFFQINLISGLLVFSGLIWFSRWAAILAMIGFTSGLLVYTHLGGAVADLEMELLGFNFILTSIAIGGVWLILQPLSLLLAAAAGGLAAVLSAALLALFGSSGLPVLALPFIATTQLLLYAMATRSISGTHLVADKPGSPEENLSRALHRQHRFVDPVKPMLFLPIMGRWTITQGPNGEHTHQGLWQHAWDFEAIFNHSPFSGDGTRLIDYHSYQAPVMAPADGRVVRVIDHLEDNPIGEVDIPNNWGNLVILWHTGDVYSALCHLEKGSITAREGEVVTAGQMLARVGNSGRSPVPHLHFQLQRSPEIGAPTCSGEFIHYLNGSDDQPVYQSHGVPDLGEEVCGFEVGETLRHTVNLGSGHSWTWNIETGDRLGEEVWTSVIDFMGVRRLTTGLSDAAVTFYSDSRHRALLDYEGRADRLLKYFYLGAARIPYLDNVSAIWFDRPPVLHFLPVAWRLVNELLLPFVELADVRTRSRMAWDGDRLKLTTRILAHSRLKSFHNLPETIIIEFLRHVGPVEIRVYDHGEEKIKATRRT